MLHALKCIWIKAKAGALWLCWVWTQVVMKQAQNVAQAVVRRPSLEGWNCIGPRRRNVVSSNVSSSGVEETTTSAVTSDKEKVDNYGVTVDECSTSAAGEIVADAGEGQQSAGSYYSTTLSTSRC